MEDEEFDFDEFMENSNHDFEMKLEEYRDKMMTIAIEVNYDNIANNGINEWHLRHLHPIELRDLNETFKLMINHFEDLEDYEKCATVLKEQQKVNSIISQKQDI
tara:strand:- start:195 stop:506 length:312 start_codon:yes stop_codon:yes gene_type:complete